MEVKILEKEQGSAMDVMEDNGFNVHDIMFSNYDLIQCLILCSSSCVESIFNPFVNAMMITIDHSERNIICAPMTYNRSFSRKLKKVDGDVKINTYVKESKNRTLFLLSTGFLLDNFDTTQSMHDFLIDEEQSYIYIEGKDIESLTVKNPTLI